MSSCVLCKCLFVVNCSKDYNQEKYKFNSNKINIQNKKKKNSNYHKDITHTKQCLKKTKKKKTQT